MQATSLSAPILNTGGLAIATADAMTVRNRLDTLTRQTGDGLQADTFGGLGANTAPALSLNTTLTRVQAWQTNIQNTAGRVQATQSALAQISSIASDFFAKTNDLNGLSPGEIDNVAAAARDALRQVGNLLDTKFGETYVFAGTDGANPPVPDPDAILSSGFYTSIAGAVGGLAGTGAAAVIAGTLATAQSNTAGVSPFSTQLSQPAASLSGQRPLVQTGADQFAPMGILASANADIASTGSSTTGSYTRDIMRALATIGGMSSSQASVAGFATLVQDTHTSLGDAITALNSDAGVLGDRSASLDSTKQHLADTATALQGQVSDAQDVDMAATLSKLTATQTQLQASYQLMSTLRSLSLANFLG